LFSCAEKDDPLAAPNLRGTARGCRTPRRSSTLGQWALHAYRRKWATERDDVPLKALMVAGGWKEIQQMLLTCYQQPTDDALHNAMAHPTKPRDRKTREKL